MGLSLVALWESIRRHRRDNRHGGWYSEVENIQVGRNRIRLDPLSTGDGSFSIIKGHHPRNRIPLQ